jgi:hypothetical protein
MRGREARAKRNVTEGSGTRPREAPMRKILLLSILFATVAIPSRAANDPTPRLALKKAILYSFGFFVLYWLLLLYLFPHLS